MVRRIGKSRSSAAFERADEADQAGKYSPAIATNRHYYLSLNGLLAAFRARRSPLECNPNESRALSAHERAACHKVYRAQAAARRAHR